MTAFICAEVGSSVGDALLYSVVGFAIVLSVLALLVGIFYLSGYLFSAGPLSGKGKKSEVPVAPVEQPGHDTDDGALVAAITAAITVMLEEENGGAKPEFVIRRVTRK